MIVLASSPLHWCSPGLTLALPFWFPSLMCRNSTTNHKLSACKPFALVCFFFFLLCAWVTQTRLSLPLTLPWHEARHEPHAHSQCLCCSLNHSTLLFLAFLCWERLSSFKDLLLLPPPQAGLVQGRLPSWPLRRQRRTELFSACLQSRHAIRMPY